MNILIITDTYYPDKRAISTMIYLLSKGLAREGSSVDVFTRKEGNIFSMPEIKKIDKNLTTFTVCWKNLQKSSFLMRGFGEFFIAVKMWIAIICYSKLRYSYIISYSPPIFQSFLASRLKYRFGAKLILNVQDIFPDNAIDLGIIKSWLIKIFFLYIEKKIYTSSDLITSHTKGSRKYLIENKNISPDKIFIVENSLSIDDYHIKNNNNFYRKKYGFKCDDIVFLFGGVIGPAQNLEKLLDISKHIRNKNIFFLVIGEGREKDKLEHMAKQECIKNVIFGGGLNVDEYKSLSAEVNFGFCILSSKNKTPVIPGKIYEFMALKLPVFGILHLESDAHKLIIESQCGFTVRADTDSKLIAKKIDKIVSIDKNYKVMGENGFLYVSKNNAIEDTIKFYNQKLISINKNEI